VKLGHVAVDGTKLRANASRHKAMSYQRMLTEEPKLAADVKAWLDQAEAADQAEDAQHGRDRRGDEMPDWVANKQRRLERIRQAKAQLEAEAASDPADLDPDGPGPSSGMQERGARKDAPSDTPPDKAQRNFTDGDSRIMPSQGGIHRGLQWSDRGGCRVSGDHCTPPQYQPGRLLRAGAVDRPDPEQSGPQSS
jgi:hypothetical protein